MKHPHLLGRLARRVLNREPETTRYLEASNCLLKLRPIPCHWLNLLAAVPDLRKIEIGLILVF